MHTNLFLFALLTFTGTNVLTEQANADAAHKGSLLIRNTYVISANSEVSKVPVNVLIEQDRIRAIGTQEFEADTEIDGTGQYLIPGLIDAHVHLLDVPGLMLPVNERATSKLYQEAAAQIPKSYLYAGFTTVLDLVNSQDFINQWNGHSLAPTAYFCSPVFIPQGYPVALLPKEIQDLPLVTSHFVHDQHSHATATIVDAGKHSPTKLVAAAKKEGARCIKVFYERGFGPYRNLPVPSQDTVREIVAAAHKQNLPVFLHGNSQEAYEFGLKTGVDMIVHGLWNGDAETTNEVVVKIANQLVNAGIAIQPTVQVIYGGRELSNPDFFRDPYVKHVMPASLINWYQSYEGQWMNREMSGGSGGDSTQTPEQHYQQVKAGYEPPLRRLKLLTQQIYERKKSLLVFGSDTPSGPMYTQFPGLNGRKEMDRWLEMGISLPDLFKAMTIGNAQRMKLDDDIGSVAKSKIANLLLLSKNPLEDVTAYDSINWIILKGQPVERKQLSANNN